MINFTTTGWPLARPLGRALTYPSVRCSSLGSFTPAAALLVGIVLLKSQAPSNHFLPSKAESQIPAQAIPCLVKK